MSLVGVSVWMLQGAARLLLCCSAGETASVPSSASPNLDAVQAENERTQSALFSARAQLEQDAASRSADTDEGAAELQQARSQNR